MRVGLCLPTFGVSYHLLAEAAQTADTMGFDSIWLWDHYVSWNNPRESVLECFTSLAALAEVTTKCQIGSLVANVTNRHPARLAKVAATLHEISGERLELGLGAGGWAAEQTPFGIDQGKRAIRTGRLEEALQIIPALWTGEPVDFDGQYYTLKQAIAAPGLKNPPPLIVGGRSPEIARLAGLYAMGLNLQWDFRESFPASLAALDTALHESGRKRESFELSLHANLRDLGSNPAEQLERWSGLGFARILLLVPIPLPLEILKGL